MSDFDLLHRTASSFNLVRNWYDLVDDDEEEEQRHDSAKVTAVTYDNDNESKKSEPEWQPVTFGAPYSSQHWYNQAPVKPISMRCDRDSIARSLKVLAKCAAVDFSLRYRMQEVSYRLTMAAMSIAAGCSTTLVQQFIIARDLSTLGVKCTLFSKILACDIFLILADYYKYVLLCDSETADALERAANCIQNDTRRIVGLLQAASSLYESVGGYADALRVERRLEAFDLSFAWIEESRRRQDRLHAKYLSNE
jgi:hypothetical protein